MRGVSSLRGWLAGVLPRSKENLRPARGEPPGGAQKERAPRIAWGPPSTARSDGASGPVPLRPMPRGEVDFEGLPVLGLPHSGHDARLRSIPGHAGLGALEACDRQIARPVDRGAPGPAIEGPFDLGMNRGRLRGGRVVGRLHVAGGVLEGAGAVTDRPPRPTAS